METPTKNKRKWKAREVKASLSTYDVDVSYRNSVYLELKLEITKLKI